MPDENPKTRSTVSLTHRQLGIGGGIVAALALISQLKTAFVPVEKWDAQERELVQMHTDVGGMRAELMEAIRRGNDKIIDRIDKSDERTARMIDSHERRLDSLEASLRLRSLKNTN